MTEQELARRRKEDFEFMVLCHAKGNPAMYELLRDRSLDDVKKPVPLADDIEKNGVT
jgi:hypothetical protein